MPILDAFTHAYVKCALWSSTDDNDKPLDDSFDICDIDPDTLQGMIDDCHDFQEDHSEDIADNSERAGNDFWLTRNHHGAGFWDGNWPSEIGRRLTEASHAWGPIDLYVGDDDMIYSQ